MRTPRRFVPQGWDSLEIRQVPSHMVPIPHVHAQKVLAEQEAVAAERKAAHHPKTPLVTPIEEINQQFASFTADFQKELTLFVQSVVLNSQASASSSSSSSSSTTQPTDNSATILNTYITDRAAVMSQQLVAYFNSLPPSELPRSPGTPGVAGPHNSVQAYIRKMIESTDPQSLSQVLIAIPQPSIIGPDLTLYHDTALNAISATQQQVITGVRMLFQSGTPSPVVPTSTTPGSTHA
jgi:hypothetical protein